MSEMTHEEATAEVFALIDQLGANAAQRVMGRVIQHEHHPDLLPELVDDECDLFRLYLAERKALEADREIAVGRFRAALLSKGKHLATLFALDEEGSA